MKVWEAIELLQGLDKTLDVTLVFGGTVGQPKFNNSMPAPQYPQWVYTQPQFWPNTITCKTTQ